MTISGASDQGPLPGQQAVDRKADGPGIEQVEQVLEQRDAVGERDPPPLGAQGLGHGRAGAHGAASSSSPSQRSSVRFTGRKPAAW